MDSDIISIQGTFILDNNTGPIVNIKDITNYSGSGISNSQVKGNITAKYGATIFHDNDSWVNPDITRSLSDNKSFFLPLDSKNKVINSTYYFTYLIQVLAEVLFTTSDINPPVASPFTTIQMSSYTQDIIDEMNATLTDPRNSNVKIQFYNGTDLLGASAFVGVNNTGLITVASVAISGFAGIDGIKIIADTLNSKTFTYSFCNKTPKAKLDVTSDCLSSTLTVNDVTNYPGNLSETPTRTLSLQYPTFSDGIPTETTIITTSASITIGPDIWTGNYVASLSTIINYTQDDGLLVQDTIIGYVDHPFNCSNSMCSLSGCISSLRSQWQQANRRGSANASNLMMQNLEVTFMVRDYNIALQCKDLPKASSIINELAIYLRNECGCNCGCGDNQTQQGEPRIVYATISTNQTSNLLSWN